MLGAGDCELLRTGTLLAQPVNAISALVWVALGGWLLSRRRPEYALLAAGVGVGSFVYHGPQPSGARWLHDLTIVAILISLTPGRRPALGVGAGATAALVLAFLPEAGVPLMLAAGAVVLARSRPLRPRAGAIAWGAAAALAAWAGRTGGPLCDPSGIVQFHGVWHVLSVVAVGIWITHPARQTEHAAH